MVKPIKLVNVNGEFGGYIMDKIDNATTIDNINDFRQVVSLYKKLFENLEQLHNNDIIVGDLKHGNILVKNNDTPIFIDVDSMGVDEHMPDHHDYMSTMTRTIPNIHEKTKNNHQ